MLKRTIQVVGFTALWGAVLFLAAGTPDWLRAWLWLGASVTMFAINGVVLARVNPEVIAARSKIPKGTKGFDKVFAAAYTLLLFVLAVVAGLDAARHHWTGMGPWSAVVGVVLLLLADVPIAWSMAVNPFLETTVRIQAERGHRAVNVGPYRYVRHPMYVGCILQNLVLPLVLGSVWTFVPAGVIAILFVVRTALEDATLRRELPGYLEFARQTRYRLMPGLW